MGEKAFNLSEVLEHNRQLVKQGKADSSYADELNNWYMKVDSVCKLGGKSFDEVAVWIPAPAKVFTSEDNGSAVDDT